MITPTNGRVVLYHPGGFDSITQHDKAKPLAAMIAHVWNDRMVNLIVFDSNGQPHGRTSVPLMQDGDATDQPGAYCEWMPYQKGQAAKTEAAEKNALELAAAARAAGPTGY